MTRLFRSWTGEDRERIEALLARAQERRTNRLLSIEQVLACVDEALADPLAFAWISGGDAPDARAKTTVCLCAVVGKMLTVGVGVAHGTATPERAFADLKEWSRVSEAANRSRVDAWAGARRPDRERFELQEPQRPGSTLEALRAQIVARPDDDVLRQIYADALIELGDPRGEWIQAQLAGVATDVPRDAYVGVETTWRRGFIERVVVSDVSVLEGELFEREPITELVIRPCPPSLDVALLLSRPWISRLRALEFISPNGAGGVRFDSFRELLETRRLHGLVSLRLEGQHVRDAGLVELAARAPGAFPRLQSLAIANDALGVRGVAALLDTRWGRQLRSLELSRGALPAAALEPLSQGPPLRWSALNLDDNALGNGGALILAQSPRLAALQSLSVSRNRIGPVGMEALLRSKRLQRLEAAGNPVGASLERLLQSR